MCAYVLPSLCLVVALIELDNSIFKNFDLNLTDVHCLQVSLIIRNLKRKYNIFTLVVFLYSGTKAGLLELGKLDVIEFNDSS